jgi:hypothetical protein
VPNASEEPTSGAIALGVEAASEGGGREGARAHVARAERAEACDLQEGADAEHQNAGGEQAADQRDRRVGGAKQQYRIDEVDRDQPDMLQAVEDANERRRGLVEAIDEGRGFLHSTVPSLRDQ